MNAQKGFTLIELVVVIVILGILAATALPKFIDLKSDASIAATNGVAGALSSAASVNFAGRTVNVANGVAVANCTDVADALQGGLPVGYTITSLVLANGISATCSLAGPNSTLATFSGIGIS